MMKNKFIIIFYNSFLKNVKKSLQYLKIEWVLIKFSMEWKRFWKNYSVIIILSHFQGTNVLLNISEKTNRLKIYLLNFIDMFSPY